MLSEDQNNLRAFAIITFASEFRRNGQP